LQPKYISVLPSTALSEDEKREFQDYQKMTTDYMNKLQRAKVGELNYRTLKRLLDTILSSIGNPNPSKFEINQYKAKNKNESKALKILKSEMDGKNTFEDVYKDI